MIDKRRRTGLLGELYAARYLRTRGYEIMSANFTVRCGEIDLVALAPDKRTVCFVEVKTRSEGQYFSPGEAVDFQKREKIKSTASVYLESYSVERGARFDIIEIILLSEGKIKLRHEKSAF